MCLKRYVRRFYKFSENLVGRVHFSLSKRAENNFKISIKKMADFMLARTICTIKVSYSSDILNSLFKFCPQPNQPPPKTPQLGGGGIFSHFANSSQPP